MLCKCINVNLRDTKQSKTKVSDSVDPTGKLKFLENLFSPVRKERPNQSLSFRKNVSMTVWSHLPRSDHDQELLIVYPAVLVLIRHCEHLQYLLSKGKVIISSFNSSIQIIILNEFDRPDLAQALVSETSSDGNQPDWTTCPAKKNKIMQISGLKAYDKSILWKLLECDTSWPYIVEDEDLCRKVSWKAKVIKSEKGTVDPVSQIYCVQ